MSLTEARRKRNNNITNVTQEHADYFKVMDADDLARCMSKWLQTEKHPDSSNIRIYTWQESAQEILDIIDGKVEPYKVS